MPTTAYAYLRVSGDEQADRGLSIAGQRRAVEQCVTEYRLHPISTPTVTRSRGEPCAS